MYFLVILIFSYCNFYFIHVCSCLFLFIHVCFFLGQKIVRGEVQLPGDRDENTVIDFEKKNWDVLNNPNKKDSFYSDADSIEQERLKWEKESQQGKKKKKKNLIT